MMVVAVAVLATACGAATDQATGDPTGELVADSAATSTPGSAATAAPTTSAATTASASIPTTADAGGADADDVSGSTDSTPSSVSTAASEPTTPSASTGSTGPAGAGQPLVIRLRLDRRVGDAATEGFAPFVQAVLTDERGWIGAGFQFTFDEADHDYTVVLAEGPEVDALCLPYNTYGRFSCQIGPVVALNADRWRTAVESWPATLDEYRTMLVNHEIGHLLGQHHPASRCPGAGQLAPVMAQQSSGVDPCRANPWPLPWEIACARQGVEPLAPPFERDITLTCGPDGPLP